MELSDSDLLSAMLLEHVRLRAMAWGTRRKTAVVMKPETVKRMNKKYIKTDVACTRLLNAAETGYRSVDATTVNSQSGPTSRPDDDT